MDYPPAERVGSYKGRYINSHGADMASQSKAWAKWLLAQSELVATRRRTTAGLTRVRFEGRALEPPSRVTDDQDEDSNLTAMMIQMIEEGLQKRGC